MNYDVVVIGGGASGFFTAINCALKNPKLKICILEKSATVLNKVKVSGGGRCNVTHAAFDNANLIKNYPRGAKALQSVFYAFSPTNTIEWFLRQGIELHTEIDGRMFPTTNNSQTIIDCFLNIASKHNIKVFTSSTCKNINKIENKFWKLSYEKDKTENIITSKFLVLACGGYHKKEQFNWLNNLSFQIHEPVPSLFTFNIKQQKLHQLMGLSIPDGRVIIRETKSTYDGPILITHWGISGPAVLKLSAFNAIELNKLDYKYNIGITWNKNITTEQLVDLIKKYKINNPKKLIVNTPLQLKDNYIIPKRLWEYLCEEALISDTTNYASLNKLEQEKLIKVLNNFQLYAEGKTTYKEEFVTAGGIDLKEITMNSMESKKHTNLFIVGELCNVDGITGGFNFQYAWSSAYIAANSITSNA